MSRTSLLTRGTESHESLSCKCIRVVRSSSSPPLHGEGGKREAEMKNCGSLVEETFCFEAKQFQLGIQETEINKQQTGKRMGVSGVSTVIRVS